MGCMIAISAKNLEHFNIMREIRYEFSDIIKEFECVYYSGKV